MLGNSKDNNDIDDTEDKEDMGDKEDTFVDTDDLDIDEVMDPEGGEDDIDESDFMKEGLEHYRETRYERALECFNCALSEDHDNPNILFNIAMCMIQGGLYSSHSELIDILDRILSLDPDYTDAWANKGSYLAACGNLMDALICLNKAVELGGDEQVFENRGNVYMELGNYKKALDDFRRSTRDEEPKPDLLYKMGIALLELQHFKEALICFDELLEKGYRKMEVILGKAEILLDMGKLEETIAICDEIIETEPDNIRAKGLKGISLQFSGRSEQARKELEEVRTIVRRKGMKETQLMRILERTLETMDN